MKTFAIMPEGCRWYNVTAATAEMAYRGVCCFFNPSRKIAIRDAETGTTKVFTQRIDINGNLVESRRCSRVNTSNFNYTCSRATLTAQTF